MPQFDEASRPPIEITSSQMMLRCYDVMVPLGLLRLLGVIGATVSPLIGGHPAILKSYLEEAHGLGVAAHSV